MARRRPRARANWLLRWGGPGGVLLALVLHFGTSNSHWYLIRQSSRWHLSLSFCGGSARAGLYRYLPGHRAGANEAGVVEGGLMTPFETVAWPSFRVMRGPSGAAQWSIFV